MRRILLALFTFFTLMEGLSWGQVPQFTTDDLRRLAAMEGKPENCENNGRREIHLVEPTEVILYKVDQHGKEEPVLNGHVILPRGTHVEREPGGKHYYTCQGGFRIWVKSGSIHEPRKRPSPKEIPRVAEPAPTLIPLPKHLVMTVEMKHSGEFTVNHKFDPSLLALLRNKESIETSDRASAWRGFSSHKEERCFDSGTGITLIGATTVGYFLGARNPDGTNAEIRNNNRGLLIGAGVAAIGAAFLPGTPGCKAGAAALGLGGGYLFGRTVKSPDEVREETPPTPMQPQPQPGGIPPPDPNAPPFPPADPPN